MALANTLASYIATVYTQTSDTMVAVAVGMGYRRI